MYTERINNNKAITLDIDSRKLLESDIVTQSVIPFLDASSNLIWRYGITNANSVC